MIRRGRIEAPFTHIIGTSLTKIQLDADEERDKKAALRREGIFYVKIFDNIPLPEQITNYVAVKKVQLDNNVLNSGKCQFYRNNVVISSNVYSPLEHCHSLAVYLAHLFPGLPKDQWPLIEERDKHIRVLLNANERLVLDEKTAHTLALTDVLLEGPMDFVTSTPAEPYYTVTPLVLTTPMIEESFLGSQIAPFLCMITPNINGRMLHHEEGELCWRRLVAPIRDYIYLRVVDCCGNSIPFAENSEITLHLIIRSSPYDIV